MSAHAYEQERIIQEIILRKEAPEPPRDPELQRNLDRVEDLLNTDPISVEGLVLEGDDTDGVEFEITADSGPNLELERLQLVKGRVQLVRAVIPAEATVANHDHEGLEILYVTRGKLRLAVRGEEERLLQPGDSCVIHDNTGHVASAVEETELLAFLAPPDPAYADPG